MTLEEFASLVKKMRDKQKAYFSIRTNQALRESKQLEGQVDAIIKTMIKEEPESPYTQQNLFK